MTRGSEPAAVSGPVKHGLPGELSRDSHEHSNESHERINEPHEHGNEPHERDSQGIGPRPSKLMHRAVALLARRDYARIELQRRLRRLLPPGNGSVGSGDGEGGDQIEQVLDHLQARGLLCDERFAAGFSRQRAGRFGAARVGHDLRQRGLPEPLIRAALKPLQDSELARARALWQRRFVRAPQSPADYARQARFLAGRGFPTDVIRQAIGCKDQDHGLE